MTASGRMEDFGDRSRCALERRFPWLGGVLADRPVSSLILKGGAVVDIDIGTTRLYRADARAVAASQVEAYLAAPQRYFRLAPVGDIPVVRDESGEVSGGVSGRMLDFLADECPKLGIDLDTMPAAPDYAGGVLIVLGLGLGYHLPELVRRTRARYIVLYEPFAEFIGHSAAALDWGAFLAEAEANRCEIALVCTPSPDEAAEEIYRHLAQVPKPFIDGSYIFTHYPAQALIQTRDALADRFYELNRCEGGVEDELRMFGNTLATLKHFSVRLIEAKPVARRPEPVFIVGAGPSLTADLAPLRRLRDGAIVMSCGTAFRILLKNGIVPDFQCDNENVGATYEAYRETRREFSFAGVTLIAALTVEPKSRALFDQTWGFFREAVTPTMMLSPEQRMLAGSAPNVANTAVRAALAMGFTDITLFGIDLGVRAGGRVHAEGSVYESLEAFADHERSQRFPLAAPGNFGGEVQTDEYFRTALDRLNRVIAEHGPVVVNCSDGVCIDGTTPRRAAALSLARPRIDRARIKAEIAAHFTEYRPEAYPYRAAVAAALAQGER